MKKTNSWLRLLMRHATVPQWLTTHKVQRQQSIITTPLMKSSRVVRTLACILEGGHATSPAPGQQRRDAFWLTLVKSMWLQEHGCSSWCWWQFVLSSGTAYSADGTVVTLQHMNIALLHYIHPFDFVGLSWQFLPVTAAAVRTKHINVPQYCAECHWPFFNAILAWKFSTSSSVQQFGTSYTRVHFCRISTRNIQTRIQAWNTLWRFISHWLRLYRKERMSNCKQKSQTMSFFNEHGQDWTGHRLRDVCFD